MSDWSSDVGSSDLHVGSKIHLVVMGSPCAEALRGHELRVAVHQGRHREGAQNPVAAHSHVPGIGRHRPGQPDPKPARDNGRDDRSEERRDGKEGGSTCRSRWSPYLQETNKIYCKLTIT